MSRQEVQPGELADNTADTHRGELAGEDHGGVGQVHSLLLAEGEGVAVQEADVAVEAGETGEVVPGGCVEVEPVLLSVEQAGLPGEAAHAGPGVDQGENDWVPGIQSGLGTSCSQ